MENEEEYNEDNEIEIDDLEYPTIESFKILNETLKDLGLEK